jgi:hypothetical protein
MNLLNDQMFQETIHVTPGNWSVCNMDIFNAYIGGAEGSYSIYPYLIKQNKYKIVQCVLRSLSTRGTSIVRFQSSAPRIGLQS